MTSALHHGPSGSFKSFAIVQRVMIPALIEGRVVVTNIRGFSDVELVAKEMDVELPDSAEIIYIDCDAGGKRAWDLVRLWFHWAPKGALIVLDEVQKVYSKKRLTTAAIKELDLPLYDADGEPNEEDAIKKAAPHWDGDRDRPETLEEAVDMHRHYHWDLYYSTTNIGKVHDELKLNLETCYRHRDLGVLLPWLKGKWVEFRHYGDNNGVSPTNYLSVKTYKADERVFNCYKSTKDGKAKHSPETAYIYKDPKFIRIVAGIFAAFALFIYAAIDAWENNTLLRSARGAEPKSAVEGDSKGFSGADRNVDSNSNVPVGPAGDVDSVETTQPIHYQKTFLTDLTKKLVVGPIVFKDDLPLYRIYVYQEQQVVSVYTNYDVDQMGFSVAVKPFGLQLIRDNKQYIIRKNLYFGDDEAMRGEAKEKVFGG